MFERLMARAMRAAESRGSATSAQLAERLKQELPRGIDVIVEDRGVRLSGRGLARRFALDPALRWLTARLR
jgi:ABC-type transport system involved in cytochrome bd biosynthesis fused ATPase/permease subunit